MHQLAFQVCRACGDRVREHGQQRRTSRNQIGRAGFEGVGQAKAVVFFIIVAVIALIQNKLTTSKEVQA